MIIFVKFNENNTSGTKTMTPTLFLLTPPLHKKWWGSDFFSLLARSLTLPILNNGAPLLGLVIYKRELDL